MRVIGIFILTFMVVLFINQISYGGCFASYCISAAFPKVFVVSSIITAVIFSLSSESRCKMQPPIIVKQQMKTCKFHGVKFSLKGAENFTESGRKKAKITAYKLIDEALDTNESHLIYNKDGMLLGESVIKYSKSSDDEEAAHSRNNEPSKQSLSLLIAGIVVIILSLTWLQPWETPSQKKQDEWDACNDKYNGQCSYVGQQFETGALEMSISEFIHGD